MFQNLANHIKLCLSTIKTMHRSIAGYNPYNLFILTIDYSTNFTTNKVLTIGHMSMFVVKSIVIQITGLAYGSINGPQSYRSHFRYITLSTRMFD